MKVRFAAVLACSSWLLITGTALARRAAVQPSPCESGTAQAGQPHRFTIADADARAALRQYVLARDRTGRGRRPRRRGCRFGERRQALLRRQRRVAASGRATTAARPGTRSSPRRRVAAIGAVTIDPTDNNTVWVGTGEDNPRNDVSYGDGVYKTTDGGDHWTNMGLRGDEVRSRASSSIRAITIT